MAGLIIANWASIGRTIMDDQTKAPTCDSSEEFSLKQWEEIDAVIDRHQNRPGALIPVLEEVQEITGYLPESIQRRVAFGLDIPLSQVYGVVTFYSFFTMVPKGRHQIRVCLGTACHVRGGQRIMESIGQKLEIATGECTEDRNFSVDIVRCLGACGVAPVVVVDDDIHKQVKSAKLDELLARYESV